MAVDPHHLNGDPDSTYHSDVDLIFIRCGSGFLFDADSDLDPTFNPDANPIPGFK
jgi:hypothetical protein